MSRMNAARLVILSAVISGAHFGAVAEKPFPGPDGLPVLKELPDPFVMNNGARVRTPEDWRKRREEIKDMLLYYEYGHMPPAPANLKAEDMSVEPALDGKAAQIRMALTMGPDNKVRIQAGLYVPTAPGKHPVLLAIEPIWNEHLLPVAQKAVDRGYIFAGYDRHDLGPDNDDRSTGVYPLYPNFDWAPLAVWAWGALRMVDYLQTRDDTDMAHIALTGHSRAGKTALLAAAMDERIALVAPHGSGAGGAGSYRICRDYAESLEKITDLKRFHYWFQPRLREFVGKEDRLPFDQHFLRALVAPRCVVSMDGTGDLWANPLGTEHIWKATQPVYDFLQVPGRNVLYFRPGGHDTTDADWTALLDYCDHFFLGKPRPADVPLPFPDLTKAFSWTAPAVQ